MQLSNVENNRKKTTIIISNIITILVQLFYLYRFNFVFNFTATNFIIIPLILLNLLSFYYVYKKRYNLAALFILIPGSIDASLLIYQAGAINAPGPFWLFTLPLFYGTFFDRKGAVVGGVVSFIILTLFVYLEKNGLLFYQISVENYKLEKIVNLYIFGLIAAGYMITYTAAYQKASQNLIDANARIDTLLRVVLHDLANQLTIINHRIKKISHRNEFNKDYFEKLQHASNRAIEIIQSVRILQKLDESSFYIKFEDVDIIKLFDEIRADFESQLQEKNLTLSIENEIKNQKFIKSNGPILTTQIIGNIINNAIKFSHEGSEIKVTIIKNKDYYQISIADKGIGIPNDILNNLFKFDSTTSRIGTNGEFGTGYGMPIMNHFVELMGGKVDINSSVTPKSSGTQFLINLPVEPLMEKSQS